MLVRKMFSAAFAVLLLNSMVIFATPDSMRAASAVQQNTKLGSSITLTKDAESNIVGYHVNGVSPSDADILVKKEAAPLSCEYTVINGITKEGSTCCYMMPSQIATAQVVESISKDLVNAGAINLEITKQVTGRK